MLLNRTLLAVIGGKARDTFPDKLTTNNTDDWFKHWIITGEKWAGELRSEGLLITANLIVTYIDYLKGQKKNRPREI